MLAGLLDVVGASSIVLHGCMRCHHFVQLPSHTSTRSGGKHPPMRRSNVDKMMERFHSWDRCRREHRVAAVENKLQAQMADATFKPQTITPAYACFGWCGLPNLIAGALWEWPLLCNRKPNWHAHVSLLYDQQSTLLFWQSFLDSLTE